jgi:hypothetical protein
MAPNQVRKEQILDLVNQWGVLIGHSVEIPDWMIDEMATSWHYVDGHSITTLYDVGRYMWAHVTHDNQPNQDHPFTGDQTAVFPWAFFGLSSTEYQTRYNTLAETWTGLTGQDFNTDIFNQYFTQAKGQLSASEFRSELLHDANMQKTYGWLRYGLDYNQFQQRKDEMRQQFGGELSNEQAVLQLQYLHQASADHSAQVVPTLTQQEKKSAEVGINLSEVR